MLAAIGKVLVEDSLRGKGYRCSFGPAAVTGKGRTFLQGNDLGGRGMALAGSEPYCPVAVQVDATSTASSPDGPAAAQETAMEHDLGAEPLINAKFG